MTDHWIPLATFFPNQQRTPEQRLYDTELLRYVANNAVFWAMCRQLKGGCTRAQRCSGNPRECVGRFTGLLPDEARDWIEASIHARRENRPFEELMEEYEDEIVAIAQWRDVVKTAFGPLREKRRGTTPGAA